MKWNSINTPLKAKTQNLQYKTPSLLIQKHHLETENKHEHFQERDQKGNFNLIQKGKIIQ